MVSEKQLVWFNRVLKTGCLKGLDVAVTRALVRHRKVTLGSLDCLRVTTAGNMAKSSFKKLQETRDTLLITSESS